VSILTQTMAFFSKPTSGNHPIYVVLPLCFLT
jgi:hypothetical protein